MTPSVILGLTNMALLKYWSCQGHIGLEGERSSRFRKYLLATGKG